MAPYGSLIGPLLEHTWATLAYRQRALRAQHLHWPWTYLEMLRSPQARRGRPGTSDDWHWWLRSATVDGSWWWLSKQCFMIMKCDWRWLSQYESSLNPFIKKMRILFRFLFVGTCYSWVLFDPLGTPQTGSSVTGEPVEGHELPSHVHLNSWLHGPGKPTTWVTSGDDNNW